MHLPTKFKSFYSLAASPEITGLPAHQIYLSLFFSLLHFNKVITANAFVSSFALVNKDLKLVFASSSGEHFEEEKIAVKCN